MNREKLKELVVGPIATVPTAFDVNYKVDYGIMEEATNRWIEGGLVTGRSALKVAASIGEGHMLREADWSRLLHTVVKAARNRVPIFGAIHHKDTNRTIEDAKRAADMGVQALQISPPIFNLPTQDDILRYYGAVSDSIEKGIIIYITHWLEHGAVLPETLARMVDFEHVVAIKWSSPKGMEYDAVFELADHFNILDNNTDPICCHRRGGRGFLTDGVEAYPQYFLRMWDMMEQGEYDRAQTEWDRFTETFKPFFHRVVTRSGSDAKVAKGMSKLMGIDMGPPLPPSIPLSDREMDELKRLMMDWGWPVTESSTAIPNATLSDVIHSSQVVVRRGRYAYVRAPRQTEIDDHFLVARDRDETTVVTEETNLTHTLFDRDVKWFKLVEIKVSHPFTAKGFIAAITRAIADRNLNVLVVSTFSKDYFLVREESMETAVSALKDLGFPLSIESDCSTY